MNNTTTSDASNRSGLAHPGTRAALTAIVAAATAFLLTLLLWNTAFDTYEFPGPVSIQLVTALAYAAAGAAPTLVLRAAGHRSERDVLAGIIAGAAMLVAAATVVFSLILRLASVADYATANGAARWIAALAAIGIAVYAVRTRPSTMRWAILAVGTVLSVLIALADDSLSSVAAGYSGISSLVLFIPQVLAFVALAYALYDPTPRPATHGGAGGTRHTNGFAVASLVLGVIGAVVLGLLFGAIALSQIRRNPDQGGRGMALVGVGLSLAWLVAAVVYIASLSG